MVTLTTDGDIYGHTFTHLQSVSEMPAFIERVYGNRKVVATRMNEGSVRGQPSKGTHLPSVQSWDARLACPQLGRTCASDPRRLALPWVSHGSTAHGGATHHSKPTRTARPCLARRSRARTARSS